jgi:hypothetical protein
VRTTLKDSTPQQVFPEVMTDDSYREDDEKEELVKKKKKESKKKDNEKKKSVAFKATTSKGKSKIESSSDEDSSSCDSDDEDAIKKEWKKQKKKHEKKGSSHKKKNDSNVATWDSDDSSSDDEDYKKKGHASIAIQEKSFIFNTPSCFMAKAAKVSSEDESNHDSSSDSDSDDDDLTKDELITMLEDCTQHFKESRKECKGLLMEKKKLMQELDQLRASYESLKVDHKNENLIVSLVIPSSSDGLTCDSTLIVENENLRRR